MQGATAIDAKYDEDRVALAMAISETRNEV